MSMPECLPLSKRLSCTPKSALLAALLLSLLSICPTASASDPTPLRFAAAEWPPYTGANLTGGGLATKIVTSAFARVGYQAQFIVHPWLRAQKMVQDGRLDGMGIAWFTEQRATTMAYSNPYLKTEIVLIKRSDDTTTYKQPEDWNNKHFAILRGYGYLDLIQSEQIKTTVLDSLEQSFGMLAKKRIDLTLEEKLNAHHRLALLPASTREQIAFSPWPLQIKPLHLTVSRRIQGHEKIIFDFNRGLQLIIDDGTYQHILQTYSPPPLGVLD